MIQISPAAIAEIKRLMRKRQGADSMLHLKVEAGGCLDWHYALGLTDRISPDEQKFECGDLSVVVNSQALSRATGLVIDYSEDLMGGGFRFRNPNVVQSCGCGNSFST